MILVILTLCNVQLQINHPRTQIVPCSATPMDHSERSYYECSPLVGENVAPQLEYSPPAPAPAAGRGAGGTVGTATLCRREGHGHLFVVDSRRGWSFLH